MEYTQIRKLSNVRIVQITDRLVPRLPSNKASSQYQLL